MNTTPKISKLYRIRRKSDNLFYDNKERFFWKRHKEVGRFFDSLLAVRRALRCGQLDLEDYDIVEYRISNNGKVTNLFEDVDKSKKSKKTKAKKF